MYFAIADLPKPVPIVRTVAASSVQPAKPKREVFHMPAHLSPILKKPVTVPVSDDISEFATLRSVAKQVGLAFYHTGPDYALLETRTPVPYGKPVPAYEFLWYVSKTYLPKPIRVNAHSIRVSNPSPCQG